MNEPTQGMNGPHYVFTAIHWVVSVTELLMVAGCAPCSKLARGGEKEVGHSTKDNLGTGAPPMND